MRGWIANFMKTTKPKLNVRLLRRIKRHILEEPNRFFMEGVVKTGPPGGQFTTLSRFIFSDLPLNVPPCGTAACIHGWTALFHGKTVNQTDDLSFAWSAKKLGLPRGSVLGLFLAYRWPEPFACRYAKATRPSRRAKIAAARIEHLISKGE